MSWDGLVVGDRWPRCGHPKTPENTAGGRQARCRECQQQRGRDYWERKRHERDDEARADLRRLGVEGVIGNEFERARQRTDRRLGRGARG